METTVDPIAPASEGTDTPAAPDKAADPKDKTPERSKFQQKLDSFRAPEQPAPAEAATDVGDEDEGAEGAAAAKKKEGKGEADVPRFTLTVPGREPTDPDVEIPVDVEAAKALGLTEKQIQDRLGQFRKGYMRAQKYEVAQRELAEQRAELRGRYEQIEQITKSPVDLLDAVEPKHHLSIARAAIARLSDEEYLALSQEVQQYDGDPSERKLAQAKAIAAATQRREQQAEQQQASTTKDRYVREVSDTIAGLIPEDMEEAQAGDFYEYAAFKIQQWAREQGPDVRLPAGDVPKLLDKLGVLDKFGLALPGKAAQNSGTAGTPRAEKVAPKGPPKPAPETAKDLQARHDRRKSAMSAPAGAGAPAAAGGPPRGQSFKERLAWFKGQGK